MISYHHRVISISNLDNKVNDNQHKTLKASQRVQYCLSGIQALREDLYYAGVTAAFAVSFAVEWAPRSVARGTKRGLEPAQGMRAVPGVRIPPPALEAAPEDFPDELNTISNRNTRLFYFTSKHTTFP